MKDDYVDFETAKLLKEKGFDIPCDNYYDSSGKTPNESVYGGANIETLDYNTDPFIKSGFSKFKTFSAPTQSMAMKYLREVHKYLIVVGNKNGNYLYLIKDLKANTDLGISNNEYIYYEEAVEAAIKYCLTNLI